VGFEPTVRLPVRLISSQVPLTTQPPFPPFVINDLQRFWRNAFLLCIPLLNPVTFACERLTGYPSAGKISKAR
jgi:hypothetical protein